MGLRKNLQDVLSNLDPYMRKLYKVVLGEGIGILYKARLDKNINPRGIKFKGNTWGLVKSVILNHDVTIGNDVVADASSIVTKDVPSNSIIVDNLTRVLSWV